MGRGRHLATRTALEFALILLILGPLTPVTHAQRYLVHSYSESDGLPSPNVFSVNQDASGRMWFVTRNGIVRYDGWEWQVNEWPREAPRSREARYVWDAQDVLWAAPEFVNGWLHRFDRRGWQRTPGPAAAPAGMRITAFAVVSRGAEALLAFGVEDGRLFLSRGGRWGEIRFGKTPARALAFVGDQLLVGSSDGLWSLKPDDPEATARRLPAVRRAVLAVSEDLRDGTVWLAGSDWIGRLDGDRLVVDVDDLPLFENPLGGRVILEPDGMGGAYVGHWSRLLHFDRARGVEPLGLRNGLITEGAVDLEIDREGNLWVVNPRGVSKVVSRRFANYRREHGLLENEVTAVLETAAGAIVLGHVSGFTLFGEEMRTLRLPDVDRPVRVLDLAEDRRGRVWAAVEGLGLAQIDGLSDVLWRSDVRGSVRSVLVDRRQRIWAASSEGIFLSTGADFEMLRVPPGLEATRRLSEGEGGAIYAATAGSGVFRHESGSWERFAAGDDDPETDNVYAVLEEAGPVVWVGTGNGLRRLEGNRIVAAIPHVDRPVYFLMRDLEERLWLGTDNGVMRWDGERLESFTIRDGVVGRETNRAAGLVDSAGRVWIGTERGVSVYRAEFERSAPIPPTVELLDVEAGGRRHPLSGEIELSPRDNNVLFRFRVVSFVDERRVSVRMRLDGFDADWLPARDLSRPEIRYTNLPPGNYRFQLQAANVFGAWSEVASSESITVLAPLWRRGWFAVLSLLSVGGLVLIVQHYIEQRRHARRLEQEVARRLDERRQIEEELARARRLESLGVLSGGIAHDFNNLMTAILGNLSLVKFDGGVRTDSRQNLANAEAAILRARDLTQQLMTFSKGGAPTRKVTPIAEIIRESASFTLSGGNLRCDCDLPDELWMVELDPGQISQVIGNLLINAAEAMPEGGTVTISGRNLERPPPTLAPGRYIEIAIRDRGHGIAAEHLERIFDPYFSTKQRGSGLGLATAYSIVGRHDGLLTAESELGRGTTFRVFLPAAAAPATCEPAREAAAATAGGRVLVMDDEGAVREVIGAVLEQEGFEVELTESGEQAIESYRRALDDSRPFDVVILDLTVRGGMGGRETIGRLIELDPTVAAIVVSGYSNDPVMARFTEFGFRACVAKPFRPDDLARAVDGVVKERRAAAGERAGTSRPTPRR